MIKILENSLNNPERISPFKVFNKFLYHTDIIILNICPASRIISYYPFFFIEFIDAEA